MIQMIFLDIIAAIFCVWAIIKIPQYWKEYKSRLSDNMITSSDKYIAKIDKVIDDANRT